MLADKNSPKFLKIDKILSSTKERIKNLPLIRLLVTNLYEKIVPFNLWFRHNQYVINNNYQNNQNLRVRYYKSAMLTPLVSINKDNLKPIKECIELMSLYQPFYPENFYAVWEFLRLDHLNSDINNFLFIGREERLGCIESIIFYHEKYQNKYQSNVYHAWLAGNEMYDSKTQCYHMMVPNVNYLEQAYKITFLNNSKKMISYDFICIDSISIFQDIFQWDKEEFDLHQTLFYFTTALDHLTKNGSMLIRLNMICSQSWTFLFYLANEYFAEHTFYRPTILNSFNSEIYLFLDKFNGNKKHKLSYYIAKNLYRQEVHKNFYLSGISDNKITASFVKEIKNWALKLLKTLSEINTDTKIPKININNAIIQWHKSADLAQIGDLKSDFDDKSMQYQIKSCAPDYHIKPMAPDGLYDQASYQNLMEKRASLNYFKRVMDTKPSNIFIKNRYHNQKSNLITWEQLTNKIGIYQNLKKILKTQYDAEMVTNAWIKIYELLNLFPDLLPNEQETVKTFSLCEAPGAFISSMNHFLSNRSQKLDWYAQTLKRTDNGKETDDALDDYFGLILSYPQRWLFGDPIIDQSGDITHSEIIKYYVGHPLLKNIDFMTADAGLVCDPTDLNEQERYLGKINMGQIICILACLPIGKSALFKTFLPMSEPLTISMMFLVTQLFEKVYLVKPSTSHSANSEIYVVLKNYKGIKKSLLEILYILLDDVRITSKTVLVPSIDNIFLKSYMEAVGSLINRQIASLTRSYYYYYHLDELNTFNTVIEKCTNDWFRLNPILSLKNRLKN